MKAFGGLLGVVGRCWANLDTSQNLGSRLHAFLDTSQKLVSRLHAFLDTSQKLVSRLHAFLDTSYSINVYIGQDDGKRGQSTHISAKMTTNVANKLIYWTR
ncbi:hypothetical protein CNQ82_10910 [Staphylococcus debuckii]|nr:hypothetical protein CNQ82_10910 [Staphylococcus debuckii]